MEGIYDSKKQFYRVFLLGYLSISSYTYSLLILWVTNFITQLYTELINLISSHGGHSFTIYAVGME